MGPRRIPSGRPPALVGRGAGQRPERPREEALRHAGRALDRAEEEDDYLSALALKAGLEAELGETDEARVRWRSCRPRTWRWAITTLALEIADLHLALGDAATALAIG